MRPTGKALSALGRLAGLVAVFSTAWAAKTVWAQTSPHSGPAAAPASIAGACGESLGVRAPLKVSSSRHELAFVATPAPAVGRHFGLDIVVCPRGKASMPVALRVDAQMPEHRHGMNYAPTVRVLGPGRYKADGLLFHMAGRWRLSFALSADGKIEYLEHEVMLK